MIEFGDKAFYIQLVVEDACDNIEQLKENGWANTFVKWAQFVKCFEFVLNNKNANIENNKQNVNKQKPINFLYIYKTNTL